MRAPPFSCPLLLVVLLAVACRGESPPGPSARLPVESGAKAPGATAPCVHFSALRPFLPEALEGMSRTKDEASTGRYGAVSMTEVERTFSGREEREVRVRIMDTTLVERLGQAIRAAAEEGRRREPSDPTAPIFWQDTVGFVRYDSQSERAEASLLVGERYVVAVSSRGFPGTVQVRRVARGLDLERLARLR